MTDKRMASERLRRETLKAIQNCTLFDDAFMSVVFQNHPECTEYVLNVVLGKKLKVEKSSVQHEVKSLRGRSIRLDIKATDARGRLYNIEVQRENKGAKPRRARYNASMLDADCPDSGAYGERLPETYVVFITEKDYWKEGLPVYRFERKCDGRKRELLFDDGLHIIYVNGAYRGADRIGDLVHDFSCANPDDMKSGVLRRSTAVYKKDEKEAVKMGGAMERFKKVVIEIEREEIAAELLKYGDSVEKVASITKLSKNKILQLKKEMLAGA